MSETGERLNPLQLIKNKWQSHQAKARAAALSKYGIEVEREVEETRRFEKDKYELGCIVRSLESAFGVKATDLEWKVRIEGFRKRTNTPADYQYLKGDQVWLSDQDYLKWVAAQKSPLGVEMKKYRMDEIQSRDQVMEALKAEKIVLMTMFHEMPNLGRSEFHMAHVRLNDQSQMVMVSDNNAVMIGFQNEGNYPSFVFTPKAPTSGMLK